MERIVYKIALDVSKPESQKHLTGFSIGETRARRLIISLMNGRIPVQFDGTEIVSMYVTKPSDTSPSIGLCSLDGSNIIYDVLQSDVSEDGVIKFTIKVQHNDDGNISILYAAHFDIQVTDPECDDSHAPDDPNYSILEGLIAQVEEYEYDSEAYAVGTRGGVPVEPGDPTYHNSAKWWAENVELLVEEQVQEAESWAVGTRGGVPVEPDDPAYHNNAKFHKEQAAASAVLAAASESAASGSASDALRYKNAASQSATDASGYASAASGSANDALGYKNDASNSATLAEGYKNTASQKATDASGYATAANGSANDALGYKNDASGYATAASNSATAASGSATTASNEALVSEGYAKGTQNNIPVTEGPYFNNSSKHFRDECQNIVADLLSHYGVTVAGTQLVFGSTFSEHFTVSVVGTQLVIQNV